MFKKTPICQQNKSQQVTFNTRKLQIDNYAKQNKNTKIMLFCAFFYLFSKMYWPK